MDAGKGRGRPVESAQVGHEGHHSPDRHGVTQHQPSTHPVHQGRTQCAEETHYHKVPSSHKRLADLQSHHLPVLLPEPLPLGPLLTEHLHKNVPAHAEGLLENVSQVGALLLGLPGQFLSDTAYPAGGHNEEWQDEDGYEGQGPAQVEDHGQGCAQDYDVGHYADHSARHNVLYAGHVAVEP